MANNRVMPSPEATLQLPVEITHRQAQAVLQQLKAALSAQKESTLAHIDASQLTQFDSSAIAVLLELKRFATQYQLSWKMLQTPKTLSTLAALYGMHNLLELDPN